MFGEPDLLENVGQWWFLLTGQALKPSYEQTIRLRSMLPDGYRSISMLWFSAINLTVVESAQYNFGSSGWTKIDPSKSCNQDFATSSNSWEIFAFSHSYWYKTTAMNGNESFQSSALLYHSEWSFGLTNQRKIIILQFCLWLWLQPRSFVKLLTIVEVVG